MILVHQIMLYVCTKFHEDIYKGFRVIARTRFPLYKLSKGNNSMKHVYGVIILVLCTSSIFVQSFMKMSQRVFSYCADTRS